MPTGVTYEAVKFKLTNVTPAQMTNIKLIINGRTLQTFPTGTILQKLNAYKGHPADAAGYLSLYFVKSYLNSIADQRLTGIGTFDVQTVNIEFDIDAAVVSPAITATALVSPNKPLGIVSKILKFSKAASAAGIQEIDNIPTNGARIESVHFMKDDIKSVEFEGNGIKMYEAEQVLAREFQKEHDRVPDSDWFHVDFCLEGTSDGAMVTEGLNDKRFKLDHTASGAMDFIVEYYDVLNGGV